MTHYFKAGVEKEGRDICVFDRPICGINKVKITDMDGKISPGKHTVSVVDNGNGFLSMYVDGASVARYIDKKDVNTYIEGIVSLKSTSTYNNGKVLILRDQFAGGRTLYVPHLEDSVKAGDFIMVKHDTIVNCNCVTENITKLNGYTHVIPAV